MPDLPIPAVPGIKATGWLVLEATRYAGGQAREVKLRRITQSPPSLGGTDVRLSADATLTRRADAGQ